MQMQAESSRICAWVILSCSTQQDSRGGTSAASSAVPRSDPAVIVGQWTKPTRTTRRWSLPNTNPRGGTSSASSAVPRRLGISHATTRGAALLHTATYQPKAPTPLEPDCYKYTPIFQNNSPRGAIPDPKNRAATTYPHDSSAMHSQTVISNTLPILIMVPLDRYLARKINEHDRA